MWLVYTILVVQYTVHVQGRIANFAFWKWVNDKYWFLRPLLSSSIANLTSRENVLKSWIAKNLTCEIYGVYSSWLKQISFKFGYYIVYSQGEGKVYKILLCQHCKTIEIQSKYQTLGQNKSAIVPLIKCWFYFICWRWRAGLVRQMRVLYREL